MPVMLVKNGINNSRSGKTTVNGRAERPDFALPQFAKNSSGTPAPFYDRSWKQYHKRTGLANRGRRE